MLPKVNLRLPKKPKLLRSNPLRFTLIRLNGLDPIDIEFDDEALINRNKRIELVHDLDDDISAHARIRLVIARVKALQKYKEIYYNSTM